MTKWKLFAGVTLVFVLGALAGSLGTGFYLKQRFEPFTREHSDKKSFIMKRLTHRLDLTEDQSRKVEEIVDRMQQEHRQYFKRRRPQMKKFITQSVTELKRELNPEQQEKLDRMIRRFDERRKRREKTRVVR